jgi:hypothetical protein
MSAGRDHGRHKFQFGKWHRVDVGPGLAVPGDQPACRHSPLIEGENIEVDPPRRTSAEVDVGASTK